MENECIFLVTPLDARRYHAICQGNYINKELHTTCINTFNLLKTSKIDVKYHDFESNNLSNVAQMSILARNLANETEFLHSQLKNKYFQIEGNQKSWDFLNLYFIFLTIQIYQSQSKKIEKIINSRKEFSVIWPNFGQDYHFDSTLLKRVIFNDFVKSGKIKKITVDNDKKTENTYKNSFNHPSINELRDAEVLLCIPTISAKDKVAVINYLDINSSNQRIVDITSPFWDVETGFKKIINSDGEEIISNNIKYESDYKSLLRNVFQTVGCDSLPKNQEQRFLERSLFQIDFYLNTCSSLNPKKIIVTNHDGGLLGPLVSLAEKKDVELHYFPHSATHNIPLKITKKCNLHTLYINKGIKNLIGSYQSKYPEIFIYENKKEYKNKTTKNALIIINDLSEYGFTKSTRLKHIENINQIGDILKQKGYDVLIRDKPTSPYEILFKELIRYKFSDANLNLDEISQDTSICVAYESATSAMNFFTKRGVLTILATDRMQSDFEFSIIPVDAQISSIGKLPNIVPNV